MKKIHFVIAGLLLSVGLFAQAPQKMSYQAVIRNSSNTLVTSMTVAMKISILQGTIAGTAVYVETQLVTTNANGLVSLEIGTGTIVTGTFAAINWANGPYFIKTETDPTGGTAYTITGTSQLMSVPYALFSAKTAPLSCLTLGDCPAGFICSGGSCIPEKGPVSGFTHYLGEPYLGGIIYYLYKGSDGYEHGLVVSLTESYEKWSATTSYTTLGADRSWDGAYNTGLMTASPAKIYIGTLGSGGWYLPSIDEVVKLFNNRYEVNKALFAGGNTLITPVPYWSSTESGSNSAMYFDFSSGNTFFYSIDKTSSLAVRGIRSF